MRPPFLPKLLSCEEAMEAVRSNFADLPKLSVEIISLDGALGRVLAAPLAADRDQPPFPRSTRDGFAVLAADLTGQAALHVIGSIRAGEVWSGAAIQAGQALEIMTGAPVPAGADAILMVEHADRKGDTLHITRSLRPGENIVPRGAEAQHGQLLLNPGTRLGPAEIALSASIGAATLSVYARPVVAILSTGDELVSVDQTPGPQQIRNSNAHALAALVRQNGGEPRILPIAADTREALESAIDVAADADMLVLSGGVSAGKYDLVEPVLLSRGATFTFTGVAMQPGKPAVFGSRPAERKGTSPLQEKAERDSSPKQWIFGLPGNPVSTQVTAMLFAVPMLRALGGEREPAPIFVSATLEEKVDVKPGLTRFLPARLTTSLHGSTIRPTGWQGSGDLHSNARANCYLIVPPDVEALAPGSPVQVLLR